jgi:hypothetical protein
MNAEIINTPIGNSDNLQTRITEDPNTNTNSDTNNIINRDDKPEVHIDAELMNISTKVENKEKEINNLNAIVNNIKEKNKIEDNAKVDENNENNNEKIISMNNNPNVSENIQIAEIKEKNELNEKNTLNIKILELEKENESLKVIIKSQEVKINELNSKYNILLRI